MRVVNYQRWPLTLEDGTILAAAGTQGSTKEVGSLSDRDHRHVGAGRIAIVTEEDPPISWIVKKPTNEFVSAPEEKLAAATPPKEGATKEVVADETPIGNFIDTRPSETKPRTRGGRTNA